MRDSRLKNKPGRHQPHRPDYTVGCSDLVLFLDFTLCWGEIFELFMRSKSWVELTPLQPGQPGRYRSGEDITRLNQGFGAGATRSQGIWLEPKPSLWPGSGSTLNICLIIHDNYMELNINWCLFNSKHKILPACTGTCVSTYFRKFVVTFKKIQDYVLFYKEPEPAAPGRKFPEPEPPQNKLAPKPWVDGGFQCQPQFL